MEREDTSIERRLDALERATEKRLDDARDIHRREHEASDNSHQRLHEAAEKAGMQFVTLYEQRFQTEKDARELARQSVDKRLEAMNEFRSQLQAQAATFQTLSQADAEHKAINARIDEIRERVVAIEKGDVKQEGKQLGQGTVIAIIVGAITFVGTILAIFIAVANFAT